MYENATVLCSVCERTKQVYVAPSIRTPKYCSLKCYAVGKSRKQPERTCPDCGLVTLQKGEHRCLACKQIASKNATVICETCGVHKRVYFNPSASPARYCSVTCAQTPLRTESWEYRKAERARMVARGTYGTSALRVVTCPICGDVFETRINVKKYCSPQCRDYQHGSHERRAARFGVHFENVSRPEVFARDGYTCQLCGDPIDPRLTYPDPMSASLDHVVPLSKGGPHTFDNCQAAHLRCNLSKGARGGEPWRSEDASPSQLRLIYATAV